MKEVLTVSRITKEVERLRKQGKKIILVGGGFDVLHPGHVVFLEKAKKAGDILVVLLESDKKLTHLKGPDRPFHTQKERARVLSALEAVDYVVTLPFMQDDFSYDELILRIKPDIIAQTFGYSSPHHKRAAEKAGARLQYVCKMLGDYSTTKILNRKSVQ